MCAANEADKNDPFEYVEAKGTFLTSTTIAVTAYKYTETTGNTVITATSGDMTSLFDVTSSTLT